MDFQFTEDQRAFADMAQGLFADYCTDDKLREHDLSGQPFMQELWQQCLTAGLHGIVVPEDAGGLGLGMTELLAVLEQQGRALAQVPLWQQQIGVAALSRFASGSAEAKEVAEAAMGGQLLALSLQATNDARGARLRLQDGRLCGRLDAVALAGQSSHALIAAAANGGERLVLVALDGQCVARVDGMRQDYCAVADLAFDHAPALAVLDAPALAWVQQHAAACLGALQQGVTQEQLQRTVQYVSERKQFDRAIGTFQLVVGQMADNYILMQAQRSALYQLVWRLDQGLPCAPQSHAVRAQTHELGLKVGRVAQHVHGGMGVDVTYPIHRFLFWGRALAVEGGSAEHHLQALGQWLADHDNLGWKYDLPEDR
ncbi:Acyl-CoA dehydrogenase [Oryzisolibacter propanilivorax]|uniref:Acyl-CoA dehydrogenase n=1 Tax=Oryzisolibacter propanilivorax TaxID=1527607 RepID=A0A1G9NXD8_9BURK|nr:acyl-CoA dehydrogenase family protein [Oryzisolibacter propanilivorax]SDL91050.1 Acyl-CoA dehydrogenase [Oryzisolibacter propanilivorax]